LNVLHWNLKKLWGLISNFMFGPSISSNPCFQTWYGRKDE
jgi:hypothetical protein